ncbi:ABC transporter ATP-binding protein, partial [Candidatus Parcubacteria bacterium]|nr:ABC transporter ATP-binding protein [Candidatus Parcubacteria bacterium]
MMEPIIEIKNISKKYNITHQQGGYVALRDILTDIAKHPFKFLKSKTKKIIGKETKEEFWALKDINFTVEKGEAVGIIGANGAGKSTLLKILSKITPPTTGQIEYKGKMSSLLEVGTGFHPELTGRENIFLNGAILGMSKKEIVEKFDAIVEFAGIGKFLDTPVKRYSSGMYVRLAFSVAAHMEPDILVVDEVLAVGDAEFQKKCLGKMDEVTKQAGRTILFVSHNM